MNVIGLLLPDLLLVACGCVLFRFMGWGREFWSGLERLVYYVLFPALLFNSALHSTVDLQQALPTLSVALLTAAIGVSLAYLARPVLRPIRVLFASGAQCAFRFNSYVLLALSQRLAGESGLTLAALLMGVCIPLFNVAAVYPLARSGGHGVFAALIRNPLIVATLAGIAGNALGLQLPEVATATLSRLGGASLALGLLAAGAALRFEHPAARDAAARRSAWQLAVWFTSVKFVATPLAAWLLAGAFGLDPVSRLIVVMFAAMPTAPSAYILASQMGGDGPFTAQLISLSMVTAVIALPLWLAVVL
ncbi:MAG: AEC family transporter [Burkholderiaceae bacterium]